ncbi:sigma-70 region 4 domain-containing protein [Heyndrickxia oleronia]|mgnify:CR=1 FL=1|uniref:Sigma-70 family RNA polymerase sigma factor n=1 Tax=Heyndrickxia oleronia TaxID=38875 RepID=A0AAW6T254_9BACI|nr:sigma-70 family RNA polymerase sigma factor [Heyndrickxia oleronia]NYV66548.1 sigma-70 family RNA polymerase sigma factor [Bacillus sp. Gen3]MCM3240687.1 sigma-70 region 4 domain-containing protein [Heyndrickxia oleronia]MCM3454888.1 sigma-70 region 4 domain-containing protein [Heyndrickxia oleronia]MDH5163364.1 sigma-70 family RNA polymerase sigma factor [Heyndrickxia oleronia]GIN41401.1 hypothetical protein J19TS1_43500 [Heyndrickxia oleronia]
MEDKNWLEMRAEYDAAISKLEKMLIPQQTTTDLSTPFVSIEQTTIYLRNQRIRSYLNNCREANKSLGIKKGEKIADHWLERLSETERKVFSKFYEQKKSVSQISIEMGLKEDKVKEYFRRSMKKVIKEIQKEEI